MVSTREQIVWEAIEMIVLSIKDSLFRAYYLQRRYHCGSNEGRRYYGMAYADECPKSTQLHGFSGILSMVCRGFLKISNSITELQKKNKKFVWTKKCTEAFGRLKELFIKTLILKVPDMDACFLLCTDASKEGLGGVLMQDD